jgi:hypothetical protein
MLLDGRLRQQDIGAAYSVLKRIPAEREEVFEAFLLDMLNSFQIESLLDGVPFGKDILLQHPKWGRIFTSKIPESVKHTLLYPGLFMSEKREQELLDERAKELKEYFKHYLATHPEQDPKEAYKFFLLQVYDYADETRAHVRGHAIEPILREYSPDGKGGKSDVVVKEIEEEVAGKDGTKKKIKKRVRQYVPVEKMSLWRLIRIWGHTAYEHEDKLRDLIFASHESEDILKAEEKAIAIVDLLTEVKHWSMLNAAIKADEEEEERRRNETLYRMKFGDDVPIGEDAEEIEEGSDEYNNNNNNSKETKEEENR